MARVLALALAATAVGFFLGVWAPRPAEGSSPWVKFLFTPQAGLNSTCLSCGWHSSCVYPYPWGTGLDFPANCSDSGQDVYLRNWGFKASGSQEWVAWGTPFTASGTLCKETYVKVFDKNMTVLGWMRYLHTDKTHDADMMMYVTVEGRKNEYVFGRMVDADNANCPGWVDGYWPRHLHELHADGASTFLLRDEGSCAGGIYPCGPQETPYPPYDPQDWWNDWARGFCIDDKDCDGFTDSIEQYLGTDPYDDCPDVVGSDDAWPLDIDMDRDISVTGDVFM